MNSTSFLKNAPEELNNTSIYMMKVNPNNGDIYIATTFYSSSNGMYTVLRKMVHLLRSSIVVDKIPKQLCSSTNIRNEINFLFIHAFILALFPSTYHGGRKQSSAIPS